MKLKLRGLKQGEHRDIFEEPANDLGLDNEQFSEKIVSNVLVNTQGKNFYVTIDSVFKLKFTCDRCADESVIQDSVTTKLLCTEDSTLDPEHEQEGLYFLLVGDDSVDLSDDIRQNIHLAIPMKILCDDNCKGLCPVCGVNLNKSTCGCSVDKTDSRWDALKKIDNSNLDN